MSYNYARVFLDRSETTKLIVSIPPWEVPVFAAVNGEEACRVLPEKVLVERDLPDADTEYDRLALRYKEDRDSGQPFVALVYGPRSVGVPKLAAEIAKCATDEIASAGIPAGDVGEADSELMASLGLDTVPQIAAGATPISE